MRRVVTNSKNKPTPASRFRVYTPPNEGVVNLNTDDVEFRGRVDFTNATVVGIGGGGNGVYGGDGLIPNGTGATLGDDENESLFSIL